MKIKWLKAGRHEGYGDICSKLTAEIEFTANDMVYQGKTGDERAKRRKIKLPDEKQKVPKISYFRDFPLGPSERNRTSGLLNPIQARYQAAPHPDICIKISIAQAI